MSKERNNPGRFKKQCMVALLAAGLFLGATGSAKAIDFKVAGEWLVGFGVGDSNLTKHTRDAQGGPKTKSNSNDDFAAGQRVRLQLDAVASEALSGTVFFEIGDQTWGKADEGGALGALAPQHGDARGQAAAALLGRKIGEPGKSEGVEVVRADHANAQHTESLLTD